MSVAKMRNYAYSYNRMKQLLLYLVVFLDSWLLQSPFLRHILDTHLLILVYQMLQQKND